MAITPPSSSQSLNGAVWAQLQQQQAQRAADQAEQNARSLQFKARDAEAQAVRAQEKARTIKVEYSQAEKEVGSTRQNLLTLESVAQLQDGLQLVRERISSSTLVEATSASVTGVINAEGQQTGTLVDVTA